MEGIPTQLCSRSAIESRLMNEVQDDKATPEVLAATKGPHLRDKACLTPAECKRMELSTHSQAGRLGTGYRAPELGDHPIPEGPSR